MNDNPSNKMPDDETDGVPNSAMPLDEELVAYLDGELSAEDVRRIDALLASDHEVRCRLQSLERTWDLLDELDTAPVGEPFTQTTLEMVALAAQREVEQGQAEAPRRRRRQLLAVGGSLLAAAFVGFLVAAQFDPDRQLFHDLPVLENLDEYRQIDSIEFLRQLRKEGLFAKEDAESSKSEPASDEKPISARQRVKEMSRSQKEQLLLAEKQFTSLPPEKKNRLWRLHKDLQKDPAEEQLRAIMQEYCEWIKPLTPLRGVELAAMPLPQRIESVKKELEQEQRREAGKQLSKEDVETLRKWADDCATRYEAEYLKTKTEQERQRFLAMPKDWQHYVVFGYIAMQRQSPDAGKLPPTRIDKDMSRLLSKLSSEANSQLKDIPTNQQWQVVRSWTRSNRHRNDDRRMRRPLPKGYSERLANFFEKELSADERDRLLAMPGEDMQAELQRMFQMRNRTPEVPSLRSEGIRHEEHPGDPQRQPSKQRASAPRR